MSTPIEYEQRLALERDTTTKAELQRRLTTALGERDDVLTEVRQMQQRLQRMIDGHKQMERERDQWREDAWACFVASGADPDGDDARHLNLGEAPREVEQLRRDYEEVMEEEDKAHQDWDKANAERERAEADLDQLLKEVREHHREAPAEYLGEADDRLHALADEIQNRRKR